MAQNKEKKKRFLKRLKNKFRLVILNDTTFEEKLSFRLSPMNVFILFISGSFLLITLITILIAFTPLREFIPGYTDVTLRQNLTNMVLKVDSLENDLTVKQHYLNNLRLIIQGELPSDTLLNDTTLAPQYDQNARKISKEDSLFRDYVEKEDAFNISNDKSGISTNPLSGTYFFTPLNGLVTGSFEPKKSHYGVDIVAPENEAIKATLKGVVIFAGWTSETGHVITLQHENNLISTYKHNSVLLKELGDVVKAGDAIAIIGNSGELTDGPHLHFELWYNGTALNPEEYINLK
jgi:murein DD-endopeptidase MepM/ murein hydrolase activator NlpD